MEIVKFLDELDLLIKDATKITEIETKNRRDSMVCC